MYTSHWGLAHPPFQIVSDPRSFFRSPTHVSSLLKLRYAIDQRLGACLLAGAVGSGKTCLADVLVHELNETFRPVVRIRYPRLSSAELLAHLRAGLSPAERARAAPAANGIYSVGDAVRDIEQLLADSRDEQRHPVVIVDDAHLIDDRDVLQSLQLVLNLASDGGPAFTLLLVGEPMLAGRIGRLPQFDERIGVKALLRPLSRAETADYVQHRLQVAGAEEPLFTPAAIEVLFEHSGGLPRRINRLCDLALLVGYADGLSSIGPAEIHAVAEELIAVVR